MISHVTAPAPANHVSSQHATAAQKPKPAPPPQKEDSVQLSSVAKAYGNVDHEGGH